MIWRVVAWLFVCSQLLNVTYAAGDSNSTSPAKTVIYFFWAEGCPHCAEEQAFLDTLVSQNKSLELRAFELLHSKENARLLLDFAHRFGYKARSAPATFVGTRHWVGFTGEIAGEITNHVNLCSQKVCPDAAGYTRPAKQPPQKTVAAKAQPKTQPKGDTASETQLFLDVPVFGRLMLTKGALWTNTALIAFADGFNPCSLWVLTMLLALIIHTRCV